MKMKRSIPRNLTTIVEEGVMPIAKAWDAAADRCGSIRRLRRRPIRPSVWRHRSPAGRAIFLSTGAQCFKCHGPQGKGDGEQTAALRRLEQEEKGDTPEQTRRIGREFFACRLRRLKPRNFTEGIFHGGDRPIDQYYRVSVGIKGTPMPPAGPSPGSKGILSPEDIWHVVNFVRSLGKLPSAK